MAITSAQQTQILKIVVGLFNGGISGTNLSALSKLVDDGMSIAALSDALANNPIFINEILGGKVTIESQVDILMNNFGVVADNNSASPGSQAKAHFMARIEGGVGFGSIVNEAVAFLAKNDLPPEFAPTAALLNNKVLVSEMYAATNPPHDTATMIALLVDVTATSPTSRAEAIVFVDNFVSGTVPDPVPENKTFTLTSGIDNLGGNNGNDVFIGDEETTSPADTLVGAEGMDVLQLFGTNITPNISGIEKVVYTTPGGDISVADFADVTSVELKNAVPGRMITTSQGQAVTLTNIDITFGNANGLGNSIRLAGDSITALDLTLDKFGALAEPGELIIDGEALSTLNITGANNASVLTIDSSQQSTNLLKTLTITGDQDVSIGGGDLTTIDASSATGRIAIQANATDLTFKGGSGDDTIRMFDTLTSGDTLTGGAGIDMLRVSNGNTVNSASAVANISEFEFFNTTGAGTYDLSFLNANNALIGLRISSDNTTVNNINAASTNNIQITTESSLGLTPELDLNASDFIAGGTSDTATITLDNSRSQTGSGVNSDVDFDNLDVLNLISKSDGTPTKILSGDEQNSLRLNASDLEKIVVTGDEALFLKGGPSTLQLGEIDASGLDAPVHIRTDAAPSILAKGTTYNDIFHFGSFITAQTTLFTGGGSDQVIVAGGSSSAHTLRFTATELNAGDLKAGDATNVELQSAEIGSTVTINLSAALEGLLKSGGTFLSATNANIDIHGTSLSNTTNIAAIKSISPAGNDRFFGHDLQFDLNGDGFFNAEDDAEISIYGDSNFDLNNTLVYDAAADALIYTVASGFVSF